MVEKRQGVVGVKEGETVLRARMRERERRRGGVRGGGGNCGLNGRTRTRRG